MQEIEEPSRSLNVDNLKIVDTKKLKILNKKETDVLPGFKVASASDGQPERYFYQELIILNSEIFRSCEELDRGC